MILDVTMNYFPKDLLTLLISLFILSSCTNPSGIGLDTHPGDEVLGALDSSSVLQLVTLRDDDAATVSLDQAANANMPSILVYQLPFGYFRDPIIGETQANLAMAITRASGDSRLEENAVIDSAVLVLRYGNSFSGDSVGSNNYAVEVRQLAAPYSTENPYTSKVWQTEDAVLGTANLSRFNLSDSISVTTFSNGRDSVIRTPPQLRIRLNNDFIQSLFSNSLDSATLNSDAGFRNHTRGFYVNVNREAQQGIGGLAAIAHDQINTLEVRYKITDAEGEVDTILKSYPIALSTSSGQTTFLSGSVNREFSTEVQNHLNNPNQEFNSVYLQGMGGLRTRITIADVDSLRGRNIAINKAELILYVDQDLQGNIAPAPRLTLYHQDIGGRRQPVPDGDLRIISTGTGISAVRDSRSLGPFGFGGFYDSTNQRYTFNLTSFLQDLILEKVYNPTLFVSPAYIPPNFSLQANQLSIPFWPEVNTPDRVVLGSGRHSRYKAKLHIYYTELP